MTVSSWRVAAACEYCVAGIALFVMMIVALVAVPRRYDPLRRPFLWLKLSIAFFAMYVTCSSIRDKNCASARLTLYVGIVVMSPSVKPHKP